MEAERAASMAAFLCDLAGRKYFSTDACNIRSAEAIGSSITRPLDERVATGIRAYTRLHMNTAGTYRKIYVAYLRVCTRAKSANVYGPL